MWEAVDKAGLGIALKFMESRNTTTSSRELRIVHAVQKLQHVNLLRLDRVWSIPDYIVVAMELADGSLLDMLDACITEYHAPLASDMLIAYVKQAAAGLDYLNGRRHSFDSKMVGFQHCDVKPSNLLLVGDVVKLADFGDFRLGNPGSVADHGDSRCAQRIAAGVGLGDQQAGAGIRI